MAKMKLLLLQLLLLVILVGVSVQRCAIEDINIMDLVLSTESIEVLHAPNINITDIYYNCLSSSQMIGLYSSTSLSVVYNRSKPAAMLEVRYNLQCIHGFWQRVGRTTTALQNNNTRTDCYSCTDQTINENHCSACDSSCTGLNQCYGPMANQCCSYNDGGVCTDDCGMNREGNSTFHCVCSNFWTGPDCDDCSLTCDNKGIRAPNCSGCQCAPRYRGMLCEININEKCDPEDAQCVGQIPEEDGDDGLSNGAILGIVVFCIAAIIILTVTVLVGVRHVWKKSKADSQQIYQPEAD